MRESRRLHLRSVSRIETKDTAESRAGQAEEIKQHHERTNK